MSKKIYIVCPSNKATGGPEALHQLGYILNQLGFDAKMMYTKKLKDPVHQFYKTYNVPFVTEVRDSAKIIIVFPESMTNLIARYPLAEKKVWWLSLDFYEILMSHRKRKENFFVSLFFPSRYKEYRFEPNPTVTHWYQSQRTKEFLETKKLDNPISYLCDYPNELFFDELPNWNNFKKENIITYNPKKGLEVIETFKNELPQYEWIALKKMSREEMRDNLRKAKLHVDFGYFPGRDKIPREALVSGCCLLTGRGGTAAFKEDLGIPEKYKLGEENQLPEKIKEEVIQIMENYQTVFMEFLPFRDFVMTEKIRMIEDVKKIFSTL
jgi:hypothetical protein